MTPGQNPYLELEHTTGWKHLLREPATVLINILLTNQQQTLNIATVTWQWPYSAVYTMLFCFNSMTSHNIKHIGKNTKQHYDIFTNIVSNIFVLFDVKQSHLRYRKNQVCPVHLLLSYKWFHHA